MKTHNVISVKSGSAPEDIRIALEAVEVALRGSERPYIVAASHWLSYSPGARESAGPVVTEGTGWDEIYRRPVKREVALHFLNGVSFEVTLEGEDSGSAAPGTGPSGSCNWTSATVVMGPRFMWTLPRTALRRIKSGFFGWSPYGWIVDKGKP